MDDFGLLGFHVCNGYFSMAEKMLRGWADLQVPRSRKELQGLLGRLKWASTFVPRYKQLIRPVEALLPVDSTFEWTRNCTNAVNNILALVFNCLKLRLPDHTLPFDLYIGFDDHVDTVILSQALVGHEYPVAVLSWRATTT